MSNVVLLVFVLAVIALQPIAAIWALNTLFGFSIAYTVKTYLAMLVVTSMLSHPTPRKSQD